MNASEQRKDNVELVNTVAAATLPSPARRGALQLNPFVTIDRQHLFQPAEHVSIGKFRKVMTESAARNFPAELCFRRSRSFTTSRDSTWDFNTRASFSSEFHISTDDMSKKDFINPSRDTPGDMICAKENIRACNKNKEMGLKETREGDLQFENGRKADNDETLHLVIPDEPKTSRAAEKGRPTENRQRSRSVRPVALYTNEDLQNEKKRFNVFTQLSMGAARQPKTPATTDKVSKTPRQDKTPRGISNTEAVIREGNQPKSLPSRMLHSRGRSSSRGQPDNSEALSPKNSLRNLLRRRSMSIRMSKAEHKRSTTASPELEQNRKDFLRPMTVTDGNKRWNMRKKCSTSMVPRASERDVEVFQTVKKPGSCSEPVSLGSRKNKNCNGVVEMKAIEEHVNGAFGRDISKHTIDVEKYLDDMSSP